MHFCTATIALAGDNQQVVRRDHFQPVSWPELEVLRFLHGDDAISEVEPFAFVQQPPKEERERLQLLYGKQPVDACFGQRGVNQIEVDAAGAKIIDGVEWKNPLTNQVEVTGEDPPEYEPPPHSAPPSMRKPGVQKGVKIAAEKPF